MRIIIFENNHQSVFPKFHVQRYKTSTSKFKETLSVGMYGRSLDKNEDEIILLFFFNLLKVITAVYSQLECNEYL